MPLLLPATSRSRRSTIGMAYAANQVNTTIFRVGALVSAGPFQYATFYNPEGVPVVARRRPDSSAPDRWDQVALPVHGNATDAHNGPVIGVSGDGIIHVAYDHHSNPLHYRYSRRPHDLRSFSDQVAMTGRDERQVTYPQFISAPDGGLYFFYRDGSSGNGNLCLNRYDPKSKKWEALQHPLIDGQGRANPYWWRPSVGPDGSLHLGWCWRDSPDARSNHDIGYMRSTDRGKTWRQADGKPVRLPITPSTTPIADRVATGSNLINQCSSTVDVQGRPHLAHYHNDSHGIPQYIHLWHDGNRWVRNVVSHRRTGFSLGGGGTLKIPISRPEIAVARDGTAYLIVRESDAGGGIRLYRSEGSNYNRWQINELTPVGEDLGDWEPSYDTTRLRTTGKLSLFVLPVKQGNHERATDNPAHRAFVLELPLG